MTIDIKIVNTWLENGTEFPRIVGLEVYTDKIVLGEPVTIYNAFGGLRVRIINKLMREMGMIHEKDYIFMSQDNPNTDLMIKIKSEEHYIMFKLHYGS